MNKIAKACLFLLLSCSSAMAAEKDEVLISGKFNRKTAGPVKLFSVTHGRLEEMASSNAASDGTFGFYFKPIYEGFYVIGTGAEGAIQNKYKFYFKGGDNLNVDVNDSSYTLTGKKTKENIALTQWHDELYPLEKKAVYFSKGISTFRDFFPELSAKAEYFEHRYKTKPTGNKSFDNIFTEVRQFDLQQMALEFVNTPRTEHPGQDDYIGFYKKMVTENSFLTNARILNMPFGARFLSGFMFVPMRLNDGKASDLDANLALAKNDTLKGELVLQRSGGLMTFVGYEDMKNKYGKYLLTADQQNRFATVGAKLADAKTGEKAINFTGQDLTGKNVSLTDFKGKIVLVDVWATWCGPCKAEIPALKKMEEEMHGKDIVFMSVSVDDEKDQQKWKDFVAKENLKGVQLFAGKTNDILKNYKITGIPRFMIFDKKGNVVMLNAPRPSGTELKLLLEKELKK